MIGFYVFLILDISDILCLEKMLWCLIILFRFNILSFLISFDKLRFIEIEECFFELLCR